MFIWPLVVSRGSPAVLDSITQVGLLLWTLLLWTGKTPTASCPAYQKWKPQIKLHCPRSACSPPRNRPPQGFFHFSSAVNTLTFIYLFIYFHEGFLVISPETWMWSAETYLSAHLSTAAQTRPEAERRDCRLHVGVEGNHLSPDVLPEHVKHRWTFQWNICSFARKVIFLFDAFYSMKMLESTKAGCF